MVFSDSPKEEENRWEALHSEIREHLDRSRREMTEITLMLEQSQLEVNKLAQRNAAASAQLQQVHEQFDTIPRPDIKSTYDYALESQQRLFVMRGQVEKLQSDQNHLKQEIAILEDVVDMLEGGSPYGRGLGSPTTITETLEMLIQAQEAERQRLSRQMHDGPAQALSNFILQTEIAVRLFDIDQTKAKEELTTLMKTATSAFQKIRDFIFELRPMMLDDLGLVPTLKRYVEALKEKSSINIQLLVTGTERRFESYLEVMIFRAIQELVINALRHSQANRITVKIDISDTSVHVSVEDDGKGINLDTIGDEGGMGLKVIRDRVEMLGGYFDIESSMEDGTRVNFQVPAGRSAVIE
jgi:two-component system sensor histidine kinase DegS